MAGSQMQCETDTFPPPPPILKIPALIRLGFFCPSPRLGAALHAGQVDIIDPHERRQIVVSVLWGTVLSVFVAGTTRREFEMVSP